MTTYIDIEGFEWKEGADRPIRAFEDNHPDRPELDFCSSCREHTDFERDSGGAWVSICCGAGPVAVDVE